MDVWFFGLQLTLQCRPDQARPSRSRGRGTSAPRSAPTSSPPPWVGSRPGQAVTWLVPVTTDHAGTPRQQTKCKLADPARKRHRAEDLRGSCGGVRPLTAAVRCRDRPPAGRPGARRPASRPGWPRAEATQGCMPWTHRPPVRVPPGSGRCRGRPSGRSGTRPRRCGARGWGAPVRTRSDPSAAVPGRDLGVGPAYTRAAAPCGTSASAVADRGGPARARRTRSRSSSAASPRSR